MEASVAAAPAGTGDGQAQQGDGSGEGQAQAPDFAAISSTLDSLSTGQEQMRQFLASQFSQEGEGQQQQQQAEPAAPAVPDINLSFLDPQSEAFNPEKAGELLGQTIEEQVEARAKALVAEQVSPVNQQLQEFVTQHEANQLAEEFPELRDEKTAEAVMTATKDLALSVGRPELASALWLTRIVHMAGQAADAAQKESGQQDPAAATLEGAAGARPGGQGALTAQQIVGGTQRGKLPFG